MKFTFMPKMGIRDHIIFALDINMSVYICMFRLPCKILTRTRMRLAPACFSNICGKDKEIGYFYRIFVN